MKSVLISIQPKWCELIANGKKTIEVRKTRPKIKTPFKVYIYCTKPKNYYKISNCMAATDENLYLSNGKVKMSDGFEFWANGVEYERLNGKVIGEFICDEITYLGNVSTDPWCALIGDVHEWHKQLVTKYACLTEEELLKYGGKYAWHISNLVIYDKPRELSEFVVEGDCLNGDCKKCKWFDGGNNYNVEADCLLPYDFHFNKSVKPLFRPPQSWCYIESEVDAE